MKWNRRIAFEFSFAAEKHRDHQKTNQIKNRYDGDYFNDGIYTNDSKEMKHMMIEYGILGNQIKNILKTNNKKIAIVIQGPSLYVNEVKNAWKGFNDNLIFSFNLPSLYEIPSYFLLADAVLLLFAVLLLEKYLADSLIQTNDKVNHQFLLKVLLYPNL